jgi:ATP-dependent helicase/nuclease subunit B
MHLIDRLKRTSLSIISELLNELTDSSFKPEFFELRIGSREIPSVKVTLNNGSVITISGIVDRVDVYRNGDNAYLRVVDYKTGSKTFSVSDIKEGFNLQMLLYIFSLTQGNVAKLENIFGGTPVAAGVTYLSIDSSKCKTDRLFDKESDVLPPVDLKRTGLILDDEDVINAVSNSGNTRILMKTPKKSSFITRESFTMLYNDVCNVLSTIGDEMLSGNINAIPKNTKESCKYCSYASVCKVSRKGNG